MADKNVPQSESISFSKFFSGLFNSVNTAKAVVTTFHQLLIALIIGGVIFIGVAAWRHFHKPKAVIPVPPIAVTTNSGHISTSSDDRRKNCWLLNFCW